jgi:hypothetical protein
VCVNPTQVCVNPTQVCVNPTQVCVNPTQVCVNRTQVCVNLTQEAGSAAESARTAERQLRQQQQQQQQQQEEVAARAERMAAEERQLVVAKEASRLVEADVAARHREASALQVRGVQSSRGVAICPALQTLSRSNSRSCPSRSSAFEVAAVKTLALLQPEADWLRVRLWSGRSRALAACGVAALCCPLHPLVEALPAGKMPSIYNAIIVNNLKQNDLILLRIRLILVANSAKSEVE